jgi:hypothetical protein
MKEMNVFELVPLPKGARALPALWVLTTKVDSVTGAETKKPRWVLDGSQQVKGEDFDKAFAQTPSMQSFMALLEVRTERNLNALQIDWTGAHLIPLDDHLTYVKQPKAFAEPGKEHWVWQLIHSMYGEVQASYLWQEERDRLRIKDCGFEGSPVEPCTFIKRFGDELAIICDAHADDAPFLYPTELATQMQEIIDIISSKHKIKVQERLSKHLGRHIAYGTG